MLVYKISQGTIKKIKLKITEIMTIPLNSIIKDKLKITDDTSFNIVETISKENELNVSIKVGDEKIIKIDPESLIKKTVDKIVREQTGLKGKINIEFVGVEGAKNKGK